METIILLKGLTGRNSFCFLSSGLFRRRYLLCWRRRFLRWDSLFFGITFFTGVAFAGVVLTFFFGLAFLDSEAFTFDVAFFT